MSDTRVSTLSRMSLSDVPEPYVYVTRKGEQVEFPNPADMDMIAGEKFLREMASKPDSVVLLEWLGKDGYNKVLDDKWTLREKAFVLDEVYSHYQEIFGTPPE